jgi:transcriptional regulator with XRE-family HTH domain
MSFGIQLRGKRNAAGIAGSLVCKKAGIARSRLSDIERGYVVPSQVEIARLSVALDELTLAKQKIAAVAAEEGWPSAL